MHFIGKNSLEDWFSHLGATVESRENSQTGTKYHCTLTDTALEISTIWSRAPLTNGYNTHRIRAIIVDSCLQDVSNRTLYGFLCSGDAIYQIVTKNGRTKLALTGKNPLTNVLGIDEINDFLNWSSPIMINGVGYVHRIVASNISESKTYSNGFMRIFQKKKLDNISKRVLYVKNAIIANLPSSQEKCVVSSKKKYSGFISCIGHIRAESERIEDLICEADIYKITRPGEPEFVREFIVGRRREQDENDLDRMLILPDVWVTLMCKKSPINQIVLDDFEQAITDDIVDSYWLTYDEFRRGGIESYFSRMDHLIRGGSYRT